LTLIEQERHCAFTFKNLAILITQKVLIKTKPFAPESVKALSLTVYLLCVIVQNTVKYRPLIS
jgi:hypothetical protein